MKQWTERSQLFTVCVCVCACVCVCVCVCVCACVCVCIQSGETHWRYTAQHTQHVDQNPKIWFKVTLFLDIYFFFYLFIYLLYI